MEPSQQQVLEQASWASGDAPSCSSTTALPRLAEPLPTAAASSSQTAPDALQPTAPDTADDEVLELPAAPRARSTGSSTSPEMIPATGPDQHRPSRPSRSKRSRMPPLPTCQGPDESRLDYLRRCLSEALEHTKRATKKWSECVVAAFAALAALSLGLIGLHPAQRNSSQLYHRHTDRAEPGPKSWRRGLACHWLSLHLLMSSPVLGSCIPVKPRVSPVAATGEEAPMYTADPFLQTGAKHSGEGQILLHHEQTIRKTALKNALKSAKGTGVAQYRGRILRTEPGARPVQAAVPPPAREHPRPEAPRRRRNRRLKVLSYNCGGLTSAFYTELLVWLKLHQPDIVFLQETHWSADRTYTTDDWHVLSSGCSAHHSGVMILLARHSFPQPCIRSEALVSGRLLLVKAQSRHSTYYMINVYQKVQDGAKESMCLRQQIWDSLQRAISMSPSRHSLIVAGDFNTSLQQHSPYTGAAVYTKGCAATAPDAHAFHQLVKQFDLRALNTFQPTPCKHTYQHHAKTVVRSQIDYILLRGRRTDSLSKCTQTLIDTDLGAWRGGPKHWPILASMPAECFYSPQAPRQDDRTRSLNAQVRQGSLWLPNVEAFQEAVQARVQHLHQWDTAALNRILQDELQARLTTSADPEDSPSPSREAPVKRMWQCHRQIKTLQHASDADAIAQCQALRQEFATLQKQVRSASKLKRQAFVTACLNQAARAARRGDIREIHLQVNKIAPKVVRRQPQLRTEQGHIMTPEQETQTLRAYWQTIYHSRHPRHPDPLKKYDLPQTLLQTALAKLPHHKALPGHYAPGLAWKLAAEPISALAERTILQDWRLDRFWIPPEWRHAWLCLLLKQGKTGKKAEDYRPIGLTDPVGKAVLGAVYRQHHQAVYASVAPFPQFAYLPRRGVPQALLRAFEHLHHARKVVAEQRLTLQQRHAGCIRQQLVGAITVSIDMSKAFDSLEPLFMHQALERSCLPSDVCRLIEHWHHGILYNIEHEKCHAQVNCHRGIRQGCAISPRVWSLFTVLIMSEMGPEWSKQHSTWFADDALFQAMVRSEAELKQHIKAIAQALWVLQKLGLTVAPTKCAVLLHLGGTQAKRVRGKLVRIHDNKPHMIFHHEGHSWCLPVVSKHDYLGATLSYTRMEDLTATRRIQAAQTSFDRLKPVITHRGLPLCLRLRIWRTCVVSSLLYALPQVGLTPAASHRVAVSFYKQLRHITKQPVHITGKSNQQLCQEYHMCDPLESIAKRAHKQRRQTTALQATLSMQDARLSDNILSCEARLDSQFQSLLHRTRTERNHQEPSVFQCPQCSHQARSKTALTKHRNQVHQAGLLPSHYTAWRTVDRFTHGCDGLPTCRWCNKSFSSWQQLQRHIHGNVCGLVPYQTPSTSATPVDLDTQSVAKPGATPLLPSPMPLNLGADATPPENAPPDQPKAVQPDADASAKQKAPPAARDPQVLQAILHNPPWEALQQCPQLRPELLHHCCLCRQWTPARGGTKIHLRGSHAEDWRKAGKSAEHQCLSHASRVTSTSGCPFCLAPKFADKRAARAHAQNCQVLFQLVFLRELQQPAPAPEATAQHSLVLKNGDRIPIAIAVPVLSQPTLEQSQFFLRHCCICAQTQPNLRSLKKHLHKAHPATWIDTDTLSRDCKAVLTTADKTCPYCSKTSRIAKDHAPYCPVIYQFCLLKRLHSAGSPDLHRFNHGGNPGTAVPGDLRADVRCRVRGKQPAQACQAGPRSLDCAPKRKLRQRQDQGERQGQVVPGNPVGCSGDTPAPARVEPVDMASCAGPGCGGCHLCHGEALLEAGNRTQRAQTGEILPVTHQCRAPRHSQAADPGLTEVERTPRPAESRLQSQVGALPPDAQGDCSAHGEIRADPGEHRSGREGQVGDHSAPHMALSGMGSDSAHSHSRSETPGRTAPGSQGAAGNHARGIEARPGRPEPVHGEAEVDGQHERCLSGLQSHGGPPEPSVPDPVRSLCEAGRALHLAAHRSEHAQGEAEAWPRSGGSPQPDVALRLRLTNPRGTNSCYVNSTFLLLIHAWAQVGTPAGLLGTLGTSLQALTSTVRPVTLRALHPIQALMRLWAHPDRQHDVAEFFSHFVSFYRMPFGQECWQTRDFRGPDLRVLDEGTLQTPIPLHIPARSANGRMRTVQDCVEQFFRGQRCGCALASVAPFLCFQLRRYRFDVSAGSVRKLATPIRLDADPIQVPIWEDVSTLQTRQVHYRVSAVAFHEGRTPSSGHYRTCLLHQGCHYITDDNAGARKLGPQLLPLVQSNSYLFLCTLQPAPADRSAEV